MANQHTTKPAAILVQYIKSGVEHDENVDKRYQRFTEIMKDSGYRRFNGKIVDENSDILDFRWMKGYDAICVYGFSEEDEFSMAYWKAMAECAKASGIILLDMVQNKAELGTKYEHVLHQFYTDQVLGLNNDQDTDQCKSCPCRDVCEDDDFDDDEDDDLEDNFGTLTTTSPAPGIAINVFGGNIFVLNSIDDLEDVLDTMDL